MTKKDSEYGLRDVYSVEKVFKMHLYNYFNSNKKRYLLKCIRLGSVTKSDTTDIDLVIRFVNSTTIDITTAYTVPLPAYIEDLQDLTEEIYTRAVLLLNKDDAAGMGEVFGEQYF